MNIPGTPAALVDYWRRMGFQHFHLRTVPGGGTGSHQAGPYLTWTLVVSAHTPVCNDPARCLILHIRR